MKTDDPIVLLLQMLNIFYFITDPFWSYILVTCMYRIVEKETAEATFSCHP